MEKLYSAVIKGNNQILVFDVIKGVNAYTINMGNVSIVTGPVITKDKLTVVVKDAKNKTTGKIYSLKTGILSYSFIITNK